MVQLFQQDLQEGAVHALIHAIHLVEDAGILYADGRISSSFHLAIMAREEFGKFNMLWKQAADMGGKNKSIDAQQITRQLKVHPKKLHAGISIVTVPQEIFASLVAAYNENDSIAIFAAYKELDNVREQQAITLHQDRMQAQYVDMNIENGNWILPGNTEKADARKHIQMVTVDLANVLLRAQSDKLALSTLMQMNQSLPPMSSFIQRIYNFLMEGDSAGCNT